MKKQGKKSRLQDEIVKFCINRDGPGKKFYIFTNDDVKKLSMPIGFRNHNDATHIDSSAGLSLLMQKENLAFVHLGTDKATRDVAQHALVRGAEHCFHSFESITQKDTTLIEHQSRPLDLLNSSEANILSLIHNHGILKEFLYSRDGKVDPHMYMSHRTRVRPSYKINGTTIPANLVQVEIDMTQEYLGQVTIFEGKNWQAKRNDFAIYQLYMPFQYYYQRMKKGEIPIRMIECCYVVRRQFENGSDIMVYLYTFSEPDEMTSIHLKKAHRFELRE